MNILSYPVYLESGKRKTFAAGLDWPGWCRSGRDEGSALLNLFAYGPRYAAVLRSMGIQFQTPSDITDLLVVEKLEGNTTTDFGAPVIIPGADTKSIDNEELERLLGVLRACWRAFDSAAERTVGIELRRGPRGGGRDLDKILDHVLEADHGYLRRLAWKHKRGDREVLTEALHQMRRAIENALEAAVHEGLPARGPRGGVLWPPRYFVRRVAWHVLDHAWEIEDRIK